MTVKILTKTVVGLVKLAWRLDMLHIPQLDNIPPPTLKPVPVKPPPPPPGPAAEPEENVTVKTYQVGETKINADPVLATYAEVVADMSNPNADAAWEYSRYDGKHDTPDLTAWSAVDEFVIRERGLDTERKRANYTAVRSFMLKGRNVTNKQIMKHFDKKISWAETYGAAVRLMINMRLKQLELDAAAPSPTEEEE